MTDTADALRSKLAKQRDELRRREARIEALDRDKRMLAHDCNKLRAENRMLREALTEAQARWQALQAAADALAGEPACAGKMRGAN